MKIKKVVSPLPKDIMFKVKRKDAVFRPLSLYLAVVGLQVVLGKALEVPRSRNMSPDGSMGSFVSDFH